MLFKTFFASALLAVSGASAQRSCGTTQPTEDQLEVANTFMVEEAKGAAGNATRLAPITVKVHWHVIATANNVRAGYLTQAALDSQLDVLNKAYAPHDIRFVEASADWTINAQWAADRSELAMKSALRKGTYADLNAYFLPGTQYLGYAYFPDRVAAGSNAFKLDGVVIRSSTVPGGGETNYDLGHTATHEIGHWLGLYHTFQGAACSGNGDFVSDTPFETQPAYGCPVGRDTCPRDPGADPITNYMDYSDDSCFEEFTTGQQTRMYSYWDTYRASFQQ